VSAAEQPGAAAPADGTTSDVEAHDDHCREVLERAFEYLDGEMGPMDCDAVKAHLEECVSCLEQVREDERLKQVIRDGCPCETAPEDLRARILVRITEVRVTAGS
jgi:mycothiol system anti-sigma-R factor